MEAISSTIATLPHLELLRRLLRESGGGGWLVGGALRNLLLGRKPKDLDFALAKGADLLPKRFAERARGSFFWLDAERQESRVVVGTGEERFVFDFSPLAGVTLEEDLRRRDFTMNALAIDLLAPEPRLMDPLGGEADLAERIIRHCSLSAFTDDPLRLLRAYRFVATIPATIAPETRALMVGQGELFASIAAERIRQEFFAILDSSHATSTLQHLTDEGLLAAIFPWLKAPQLQRLSRVEGYLRNLPHYFPAQAEALQEQLKVPVEEGVTAWGVVLLAALLPITKESPCLAADSLRLGRKGAAMLQLLGRSGEACQQLARYPLTPRSLFRFMRDHHPAAVEMLLLASADKELPAETTATLLTYYFSSYSKEGGELLSGGEVMALLGIPPGPAVGSALELVKGAERRGEVIDRPGAQALLRKNLLTESKEPG
jgi:poly(A) polymerase